MAFIQVSFMSKTLMRTVPLQVILPVDKFTFGHPRGGKIGVHLAVCNFPAEVVRVTVVF